MAGRSRLGTISMKTINFKGAKKIIDNNPRNHLRHDLVQVLKSQL